MRPTLFSPVHAFPGGPQTGIYMLIMAPGNAYCLGGVTICVWPGASMHFVGDEANDNLMGCVWG